ISIGFDHWRSPARDYFAFETLDQEGSWLMVPPKREPAAESRITRDDDLMVRYVAGSEVFSGLIYLAARMQGNDELPWVDAMREACQLPHGREILQYMGVKDVRQVTAEPDKQESCLLFQCTAYDIGEFCISKGYACLTDQPTRTSDNLDTEPVDYMVGSPVF